MNSAIKLKVLITGVTGFVGGAVARRLCRDTKGAYTLRAAVRQSNPDLPAEMSPIAIAGLDAEADWQEAVKDVDAVIHAAARVHVMDERVSDPLAEFRRTNVDGTLNLARQAAEAGVRRFVFVSSIKVNGETTTPDHPFRADDICRPLDPYGISKLEAEQGLFQVSKKSGMELVCIRPPLVYGPGVKANFLYMMRLLKRGVPFPFGDIRNKRSLVGLDNLVDLIVTCLHHPAASNQICLAGDGEDLSTTELLRRVGRALGKPARLMPVPAFLLETGAALMGKRDVAQRLLGSLQVDISKTCELLDWAPPVSVDEGLRKTANAFLAGQRL